jgi:glutamyl/glutaminyl-tRNA synthetase
MPLITSAPLLTVDCAEEGYSDHCLYDMEGSAFIETASRFSVFELIHLYKVVSDNKATGTAHINKHFAQRLLAGKVDEIDSLINNLQEVRRGAVDSIPEEHEHAYLTQNIPFTFSQQLQLRRLLQRYYSLAPQTRLNMDQYQARSAKQVLNSIEQMLAELSLGTYAR